MALLPVTYKEYIIIYYVLITFISAPFLSIFILNHYVRDDKIIDRTTAALLGMFAATIWPITIPVFIGIKLTKDEDKAP